MDKYREEFEAYFKDHHADSFYSVDVALEMRGDDYIDFLASDLWAIWQHQQAKVEELQKQNAWLSDIAERENKRANKLKEEHVSTTILLGKVEQQKVELQKRVEWLEDRLKAIDTLSKMRSAVIGSFNTQEFNARTRRKMMILKQAEQALKGEGQ
ncbi:TPA: hypothetical protein JIF31_001541 [Acinetobacter baumannii]|nr:hypothetical protein [Acinetobacter baumannii]